MQFDYTFFLHADDGARLYLDHVLLIDAWESSSRTVEQRATVELAAGNFPDVKVLDGNTKHKNIIDLECCAIPMAKHLDGMVAMAGGSSVKNCLVGRNVQNVKALWFCPRSRHLVN